MTAYKTLEVPQDRETGVQPVAEAGFRWRFAYSRSADTRKENALGQDRLVVRYGRGALAFALCDGVSQSFFGEIAARILAKTLVNWLWAALPETYVQQEIATALVGQLNQLVGGATRLVRAYKLEGNIPPLVLEVLEQKRALGSESTFVCGRLDRPSSIFPDGRLILAWLGDSRLRLWDTEGEQTGLLGDTFITAERWSSRRGIVGARPHIFVAPLVHDAQHSFTHLMAYSDGLAALDPRPIPLRNSDISGLITAMDESPVSDDISFLEVVEIDPTPVPEGDVPRPGAEIEQPPAIPAPAGLEAQYRQKRIWAAWEAVPGASNYEVQVSIQGWEGKQNFLVRKTSWTSSPLKAENYLVCVRAMVRGQPGDWAEALTNHRGPGRRTSPTGVWLLVFFVVLCAGILIYMNKKEIQPILDKASEEVIAFSRTLPMVVKAVETPAPSPPEQKINPSKRVIPPTAIFMQTITPTPTLTPTMDADPLVYDNFNNPAFDSKINPGRWILTTQTTGGVRQEQSYLSFSLPGKESVSLQGNNLPILHSGSPFFIEASMKLGKDSGNGFVSIEIVFDNGQKLRGELHKDTGRIFCQFWNGLQNDKNVFNKPAKLNRRYTLRIEVNPAQNWIRFLIDGKEVPEFSPAQRLSNPGTPNIVIHAESSDTDKPFTADIDYVKYGWLP